MTRRSLIFCLLSTAFIPLFLIIAISCTKGKQAPISSYSVDTTTSINDVNQVAIRGTSDRATTLAYQTVCADRLAQQETKTALASSPTFITTETPLIAYEDWVATRAALPTITPAPYWDLQPLGITPEGGWLVYRNDRYGFSFEYPAAYDTGACGSIYVEERYEGEFISFKYGTIVIRITVSWQGNLHEYVSSEVASSEIQMATVIEEFTIDGVTAYRYIQQFDPEAATDYRKSAYVSYEGNLYYLRYSLVNFIGCDAPN
jgi:hypothetical protein